MQPESLTFAPGRLTLRHAMIIAVFGLLVLLPASWPGNITLSSHEVMAAQPAREMLRDGHWLIQHYAGVPRYEKPPTASWLIAASIALFHTDAVWAVRLPSVLAGIASAIVIAAMAARWLGALAGLLAGLVQLSCVWLLTQANLAEADIHLVLWISVAMWLFARGNVGSPGNEDSPWVRRAFMASLGILFLFKGPIPLVFAVLGIALWVVVTRRWQTWRFFVDPIGIVIFVALLAAWPVAALVSDPQIWGMWKQELTGYAGSETFGRKSTFLYVFNIPLMLMPWTLLLVPTAIAAKRRGWFRRPVALLLICWFVPGMCILQFAAYKSTHYAFPLLPPFSIAMAAGLMIWTRAQQEHETVKRRMMASIIATVAVAGIIVIGVVRPKLPASIPAVICLIAVGLLFTLLLEHRGQIGRAFAALFGTVGLALFMTDLLVLPVVKGEPISRDLAQRINSRMTPGQKLYLVDVGYDETVWYLKQPLERIDEVRQFEKQPLPAEGAYVLTRQRSLPELQQHYATTQLDRLQDDRPRSQSALPVFLELRAMPAVTQPTQPATTAPSSRPAVERF